MILPGARVAWTTPSEFLDTTLQEGGKPIRLEVVIEKPSGSGPFPLLVFNHGSTGRGTDANFFKATYASSEIADLFVEKGWIVAFPQRRGRGKSDGLYDEGFALDRAQGYSCDPGRSLPGADRALDDIEAAVDALRRRADVAAGPILSGGVSRGGVLSIAYAGMHPEQVLGALDFVGGWLGLAKYAGAHWNPSLLKDPYGLSLDRYKFDNFLKEIYLDSDTKVALLSGAPFDNPAAWFLSNDQIKLANQTVNSIAGSKRLLFHSLFTPGQPGWMEEVDRCIAEVKPNSWKGYTIGDPLQPQTTKYPWRLDDEKLVYPFYERAVKAGITTVCIHKGLLRRIMRLRSRAGPGNTPM